MTVLSLQTGWRKHVPYHPQAEAAECGLACLAMIAAYHGMDVDTAALRRRFSVSLRGMTLAQIMTLAEQMGLKPRALQLELKHIPDLTCPCILHWNMDHFVVLEAVRGQRAIIVDPARGRREVSRQEVSKCFTGYALELAPTPAFVDAEPEPTGPSPLAGLLATKGLFKSLALVFLLSLGLHGLVLLAPFYTQLAIDQAVPASDKDLMLMLLGGFGLLLGLQAFVSLIRSWVVMSTSQRLNVQWGSQIFSHLLQLPIVFFERRRVGDILTRFGSLHAIQRAVTSTFVEAALDGTLALLTLAMLFLYSPTLAALVLASVVIYAVVRIAMQSTLRTAHEETIQHSAKQQSHFLETLRGMQTVKLFGNEAHRRVRWHNLFVEMANASMRGSRVTMGINAFGVFLFGLQHLLVIWYAAHQVMDTTFSLGMLFAFLAYRDQFTTRASGLIDRVAEIAMLRVELRRLADISNSEPEPVSTGQVHASPVIPTIEFRNVAFSYSDADAPILTDINLVIPAGSNLALVGPSGCGKTTLAKLLLGVLVPTRGEILFDGLPLSPKTAGRLRALCGAVMQDDGLFAGSIADNIACFAPEIDMDRVHQCAEMAGVDQDIQRMAMAYHTVLGEQGGALSGGQRQRILLARALYRQPKVLVLDEATSHLDVERERQVNKAVAGLAATRIVIAHRPETIRNAQRVVELEAGRIARDFSRPEEAQAPSPS